MAKPIRPKEPIKTATIKKSLQSINREIVLKLLKTARKQHTSKEIVRTLLINGLNARQLNARDISLNNPAMNVFELKDLHDLGYSIYDIRDARLITEGNYKREPYTPKEYLEAGYSLAEINENGFNTLRSNKNPKETYPVAVPKQSMTIQRPIKPIATSPERIKRIKERISQGYGSENLKKFGASARELYLANFPLEKISFEHYGIDEVIDAGYNDNDTFMSFLQQSKGRDKKSLKLKKENNKKLEDYLTLYSKKREDRIRHAKYPVSLLRKGGFNAKELKPFYSAKELREGGYSGPELYHAGFTPKEIVDAGYNLLEYELNKEMLEAYKKKAERLKRIR